jgi:BarA-like signal transduction histidine kinase
MVNRAAALILISLLVASCLNVSKTKAIVELPKQVHMSLDIVRNLGRSASSIVKRESCDNPLSVSKAVQ